MTINKNIQTHWNEIAKSYDKVMLNDKSYQEQVDNIIREMDVSPEKILDLGCGTGTLVCKARQKFPYAEITALDPAPDMLQILGDKFKEDKKIKYLLGSADKLEIEDSSLDYVITNWALHHLTHDNKGECAKEVFRVLKTGGKFILGDQFAGVMGEVHEMKRVQHILELLYKKSCYYLENVSFDRMLLQVKLMPKFLLEEGECLATSEFWKQAMVSAGFKQIKVIDANPIYMLNKVLVGLK